ncbi:chromosome partition protein MukB [Aeromonas encheleia]|uniref:chromosome partition protein MukB n=1 Tax=Aeromonas encheleia TaxID=73010 RepID=UPI001F56A780|nr:chromosome partition protein MukB [Aeromonas encheleia]UNP90047.1 chromosome partition protein MukB [Aeromonas encheleia]
MRGKFKSLTMVNWNGFFARTFDLDQLVTTLSGGNGAGKSTTMAAFIAALIPDQSLLHFRNTTEAGSSSASRDKGLYGKLQRGHCYSVLEVMNSREQRIWVGVHLEQVANRDNKVNITPFALVDVPEGLAPTDLLLEKLQDGKGRVRAFADLKGAAAELGAMKVAKFNTVTDYHNFMFEFGITPKKLRDQKDRGKFYRLIEASLYGGISSSISRSLREYLLPENSGVRKAFQDMEAAIYENRRTLEAIKETQGQRDLFKNLITETTHYVAADYVRNAAEKNRLSELALKARAELAGKRRLLAEEKQRAIYLADEVEQLTNREKLLTDELESAAEHLAKVMAAVSLQKKIELYRADLADLNDKLEQQQAVVEEIHSQLLEVEERKELAQAEVDSLKTQLADYQQALDIQQTRAIQYRQAVQALDSAREQCELPGLSAEQASDTLHQFRAVEQSLTSRVLGAEQQLALAKAAVAEHQAALTLLLSIAPETAREAAWPTAQALLKRHIEDKARIAQGQGLRAALARLEKESESQKALFKLRDELAQASGQQIASGDELEIFLEAQRTRQEELADQQSDLSQRRASLEHQGVQLGRDIGELTKLAPRWLKSFEKLEQLREQSGLALASAEALSAGMQTVLDKEREFEQESNRIQARKQGLELQIRNLQLGAGEADPRLARIAEQVGGVLLSDVYDDISIDDAPYYSALYGPARSALVVLDLEGAIERLKKLEDCPEDIYLIQGNPDSFDEDLVEADELGDAVLVRSSKRQVRFSRYPELPLFGRAAREKRIEQLDLERENLIEGYAKAAFEQQKYHRLYGHFRDFIGQHLDIAFRPDPEAEVQAKQAEQRKLQGTIAECDKQLGEAKAAGAQMTRHIQLVQAMLPFAHLFAEGDLAARLEAAHADVASLKQAEAFIGQHGKALERLETLVQVLRQDPQDLAALQAAFDEVNEQLAEQKRRAYALDQLVARLPHFAYQDAQDLLGKASEMSERLKEKLKAAELAARTAGEQHKQIAQRHTEALQLRTALHSSASAKRQTLNEFEQELAAMGLTLSADMEEKSRAHKKEIEELLIRTRSRRTSAEAQLQVCKREIESLGGRLKLEGKDYFGARKSLVGHKASWSRVVRLARETDVEKRLNKRELAYLDSDELRSMSDKALGALRVAVAHDEALRDALRLSEGNRSTEQKVAFYVQVYRYLKDRIRNDIIRSDDPVEAIEEMEIELARLADELKQRETHLSLSSHEVAAKITNIIRREQNRIRVLNQGLQNIAFGLVRGVRLNVNIREAHTRLLTALADQSAMHNDLFADKELSFSEAMAKLFQRLNPQIEQGERSYQVMGDVLLDYRNYLELEIEVQRGADGWLRAESGALSTGEAIGTGQAILLMVLISWEEESRRLRGKDIAPCRLLFLDEAARLDGKSIATLFELCERQDMQLLIAAPENISPEKGTTYKLIRKVQGKHEHVHVVGLRGFGFADDKLIA